jgi:hypothetical protein
MRQLTDGEQAAMNKAWDKHFSDEPQLSFYDSLEVGFTTALDHADTQLAALTAERDALRAARVKDVKHLKKMVKSWRDYAAGHYCSTYNREMAHGLNNAANDLEDYINGWLSGELK